MSWQDLRIVLFAIGAFIAMRELLTWYWKINRLLNVLEDIAVSLRTLPSVKAYDEYFDRAPRKAA